MPNVCKGMRGILGWLGDILTKSRLHGQNKPVRNIEFRPRTLWMKSVSIWPTGRGGQYSPTQVFQEGHTQSRGRSKAIRGSLYIKKPIRQV